MVYRLERIFLPKRNSTFDTKKSISFRFEDTRLVVVWHTFLVIVSLACLKKPCFFPSLTKVWRMKQQKHDVIDRKRCSCLRSIEDAMIISGFMLHFLLCHSSSVKNRRITETNDSTLFSQKEFLTPNRPFLPPKFYIRVTVLSGLLFNWKSVLTLGIQCSFFAFLNKWEICWWQDRQDTLLLFLQKGILEDLFLTWKPHWHYQDVFRKKKPRRTVKNRSGEEN